ncbi:MAG: helix-turn-helix domain-containing protein [Okeania sp. SIO2H7]|nr:helix-turn-helix domain-containing protein [Okeania sp. SIO2H7]
MKLPKYRLGDPVLPTESDAELAAKSSHNLASSLQEFKKKYKLKIQENENNTNTIEIPDFVLELLLEILVHTAKGNAVKITPYTSELHIFQAAEILGVSDSYVWELLDAGKIPYQIVDNCRQMLYKDVMEYKQRTYEEAQKALDEMVAEAEAMGLYD